MRKTLVGLPRRNQVGLLALEGIQQDAQDRIARVKECARMIRGDRIQESVLSVRDRAGLVAHVADGVREPVEAREHLVELGRAPRVLEAQRI